MTFSGISSGGVSRLRIHQDELCFRKQKGMGNQIFNEITQQNDLIDDIDDRVENVNQRLINTNDNISVVTKKDRTCGYWIVITILAIAILVVIFA